MSGWANKSGAELRHKQLRGMRKRITQIEQAHLMSSILDELLPGMRKGVVAIAKKSKPMKKGGGGKGC